MSPPTDTLHLPPSSSAPSSLSSQCVQGQCTSLFPGSLPSLHLGPRRWALGPCSCGRLGVETLSAITPKDWSQKQGRELFLSGVASLGL